MRKSMTCQKEDILKGRVKSQLYYRYMRKKQSQITSEDSFGEKLLFRKENNLQVPKATRNLFGGNRKSGIEQQSSYYRLAYFLKGLIGCVGGFMIHLVIGSLYQWGLINPYITSYFKLNSYPEIQNKQMGVIFPLMMFCIGVTMKVGLDLGAKFGYWKVLLANFLACSIFVWCSSYCSNLLAFITLYSLGFGLSAGMTFMVPMRICNQYFPNKQTYVNGFILIGTGLGSVVFGLFSINFVNPMKKNPINGYYIDPSLEDIPAKIPECIRWLAVLYLITGTIGSLLLRPLQKFNHIQEEMEKTIISQTLVKKMVNDSGFCLSCIEAIKSPIFWIHVVIIILGSCGNLFINSNYKPYAKGKIVDDQFLTLVGLIGSVGNGVSRFFWSSLFNRVGYKIVCTIILLLNIICLGTLRFTVQTQQIYLGVVFIFNCCLGGLLVMAPTFSSTVFGKEVGPKIFGVFWCSFATGNFLQYLFVIGIEGSIGLDGIIYICMGMNLVNLIIIVSYDFRAKWKNELKFFKFKALPKYEMVKDENQLLIYSVVSNRTKQDDIMNSLITGRDVYYS